ncbi:MAG: DUF1508 domain-containing protein [Sphingomicrobium sp.]
MNSRPYPSYWIYRDRSGQWRWTYEARNGETIAVSSESYIRRADCEHAIDLMKASSGNPVWTPTSDLKAA